MQHIDLIQKGEHNPVQTLYAAPNRSICRGLINTLTQIMGQDAFDIICGYQFNSEILNKKNPIFICTTPVLNIKLSKMIQKAEKKKNYTSLKKFIESHYIFMDEPQDIQPYTLRLKGLLQKLATLTKLPINVVQMSGTMPKNPKECTSLNATEENTVIIEGETHPLETIFLPKELDKEEKMSEKINWAIRNALDKGCKNIIIFSSTIAKLTGYLSNAKKQFPRLEFLSFNGKSEEEEINKALHGNQSGNLQVIFATSCCQAGISPHDVDVTISTCENIIVGETQMDTRTKCSLTDLKQQGGRANRFKNGFHYILITKSEFEQLYAKDQDENIKNEFPSNDMHLSKYLKAHYAEVLDCYLYGQNPLEMFPGIDPEKVDNAKEFLIGKNCIGENLEITKIGRLVCKLYELPIESAILLADAKINKRYQTFALHKLFVALVCAKCAKDTDIIHNKDPKIESNFDTSDDIIHMCDIFGKFMNESYGHNISKWAKNNNITYRFVSYTYKLYNSLFRLLFHPEYRPNYTRMNDCDISRILSQIGKKYISKNIIHFSSVVNKGTTGYALGCMNNIYSICFRVTAPEVKSDSDADSNVESDTESVKVHSEEEEEVEFDANGSWANGLGARAGGGIAPDGFESMSSDEDD